MCESVFVSVFEGEMEAGVFVTRSTKLLGVRWAEAGKLGSAASSAAAAPDAPPRAKRNRPINTAHASREPPSNTNSNTDTPSDTPSLTIGPITGQDVMNR